MHRLAVRLQWLAAALIASAAVCSIGLDSAGAQQPVEPQPVDFTLLDVAGKPVRLSSYRGRWVVINFWATWCAPCLREIPELSWVNEKYNTKVAVIGVNYEDIDNVRLKRFLRKHDIDYPVVRIGEQPLSPFEPLIGLPSTFFVDPRGYYVARHTGVVSASDITKLLK